MAPNRIELEAQPASKGLALGRARVVYPLHFEVEPEPIAPRDVGAEIIRFEAALDANATLVANRFNESE